jgi:hypothetical protein
MTSEQWHLVQRLNLCRLGAFGFAKQFIADMLLRGEDHELTERRAAALDGLAHRFRAQLAEMAPQTGDSCTRS